MLDKQVMLREEKTGSWLEQNTWQANLTWELRGIVLEMGGGLFRVYPCSLERLNFVLDS